jgi:Fur family ferric uptake transcriptional regulator
MTKKQIAEEHTPLDKLLQELRKSALRVTEPRVAVLEILLKKHGPFTVEEIHKRISSGVCDLATIYRTVSVLEKSNIIKRCEFGDGTARYELYEREEHHHHHLVCKVCKKIEILDDCELHNIDQFAKKRGFSDISHSLEFFGICPECQS